MFAEIGFSKAKTLSETGFSKAKKGVEMADFVPKEEMEKLERMRLIIEKTKELLEEAERDFRKELTMIADGLHMPENAVVKIDMDTGEIRVVGRTGVKAYCQEDVSIQEGPDKNN